jgi:type IV secretory pathway protease TraF
LNRVAAAEDLVVGAADDTISIDGVDVAERLEHDSTGRLLPTWRGCRTLAVGEVFLLGDTDDSFDGRYWGPTSTDLIGGVWRPLSD